MTKPERERLLQHLQTAVEIELSTIPIYLYTYYSINRVPENTDPYPDGKELATFVNMAGGLIMSVAVEEMLHLSLACNMLRALGGQPRLYNLPQNTPPYPTNLPHHKAGFSVGLSILSVTQLEKFKGIEQPEKAGAPPEGDDYETIGQFYDAITLMINQTKDADYQNAPFQLNNVNAAGQDTGYYADNNVDTVYPKNGYYLQNPIDPAKPWERGVKEVQYPNSSNSGMLKAITCQQDAWDAINIIKHQGEGYTGDPSHEGDDPAKDEDSHWFKFNQLYTQIQAFKATELASVLHPFPDNPVKSQFPSYMQPLVDLSNAVYAYLLWITEVSFTLQGPAQQSMFYIGMHKGMIFILDKIIGGMRYLSPAKGVALAPTFENYVFTSQQTAKQELVALAEKVAADSSLNLDSNILQRIKDLPDVNVVNGVVSFA